MQRRRLNSALYIVYSLVFVVVGKLVKLFSFFSPKLKSQLTNRPSVSDLAASLQKKRKGFQKAVLFFCSSAGEYEQARPLIDRLTNNNVFVHTLVFSKSGHDYISARKDDVSYSLTPITDSVWDWGWIFSAIRPSIIAVVRHELWPGFIWSARNYGCLVLINASRSIGEAKSKPKKAIRAALLRMFDKIYTVSPRDAEFFKREYHIKNLSVIVSGDTKYDRALERTKSAGLPNSQLKTLLSQPNKRLIIGSAHPEDIDCFLSAVKLQPNILNTWHVVIAPHHIDSISIKLCQEKLENAGIANTIYTKTAGNIALNQNQLLILDTMGMLAETYSFGTAAFVGGAIHYQVHNVLEPAVHGLRLAWGPKYENSQEAVQLVTDKIAQVIHKPVDFATWLNDISIDKSGYTYSTISAVGSLKGASDLLIKDWTSLLHG